MAKMKGVKGSLVITWKRGLYYSDYIPRDFFEKDVDNIKVSHPILIDEKSGEFHTANCLLKVFGSKAVLGYRGMNDAESLVEDGVMTVIFKGKGRKAVKRIDYIGANGKPKVDAAKFSWSDEDETALEGKRILKEMELISRNAKIMNAKKAEKKHACEACGYRLEVNGRFIVDCHHKNPVSMGEGKTKKSDLLVLCPNCHRVAHAGNNAKPLSLSSIKKILREAGLPVAKDT